jgi:hypothetical protein
MKKMKKKLFVKKKRKEGGMSDDFSAPFVDFQWRCLPLKKKKQTTKSTTVQMAKER